VRDTRHSRRPALEDHLILGGGQLPSRDPSVEVAFPEEAGSTNIHEDPVGTAPFDFAPDLIDGSGVRDIFSRALPSPAGQGRQRGHACGYADTKRLWKLKYGELALALGNRERGCERLR
jgi:hypothetical protein